MDPFRFSRPKVGVGIQCIMAPVQNATHQFWNKPEVLGGMVYLPAGLLAGQIEFRPTVELWSGGRPKWMTKASTIKESFPDNGTVERIQELLENLDQRN